MLHIVGLKANYILFFTRTHFKSLNISMEMGVTSVMERNLQVGLFLLFNIILYLERIIGN